MFIHIYWKIRINTWHNNQVGDKRQWGMPDCFACAMSYAAWAYNTTSSQKTDLQCDMYCKDAICRVLNH